MKRYRPLFALLADILVFGMVVAAVIWMFFGFDGVLASNGFEAFKYFTVQSNVVVGIATLVAIPFDILSLRNSTRVTPKALRVFLVCAVTGTTITMLVALFFLAPSLGLAMMLAEANLLLHLLIPLIALARVLFFDDAKDKTRFYHAFFALCHIGIYGIVYLANVAIHNGYGQVAYDWYGFGKAGLGVGILAFLIILGLAYGLCFGIFALQNVFVSHRQSKGN